MTLPLNIAIAQLDPTVGNLAHNKEKILRRWAETPEDVDLIVFSELVVSGYPPEDLILKPVFLDQVHLTIDAILEESKGFKQAAIIGTPWRVDDEIYNTALMIENGKIIAEINKHNLPNYGVFDEQRIFTSGDLPYPVEFKGVDLGIMVCEDMWSPDVAAHLKEEHADILIVPNASPFQSDKKGIRLEHAKNRVRETGLPLIYANQVGGQDELVFDGHSFALDETAAVMFEAPPFEEGVYEVDGESAEPIDETETIYKALVLGLRDYITKNGFPGVLIGMSGGIDSALSAAIAADALGPKNVHCVMMPSQFTSQESLDDAQECAEALGVNYELIPIDQPMSSFNTIMPGLEGIAHENIQPRIRGLILMGLSNKSGYMVLSTGNKSEMAVGYATLYGDMCGGFNALKDLYKMQVYELSRWRNTQSQVIPENIITKAPTAELKDNQTDQDTLPEYAELDDILMSLIEHEMSIEEIVAKGHKIETVQHVWKMLDASEYKRRQAPPGIKITSRAFGRDRRYPITNWFGKQVEKTGS